MIERDLAEHLRKRADVTTWLRDSIFLSRRPHETQREIAMTIDRAGTNRVYHLQGEANVAEAAIGLTIYGRGQNAEKNVYAAFESIRAEISGFSGEWNETRILGSTIEGEDFTSSPPGDGSDHWLYEFAVDLRVHHDQTGTLLSAKPDTLETSLFMLSDARVLMLSDGSVLNLTQDMNDG